MISLGRCCAGSWRGNSAGVATGLLGCRRLQNQPWGRRLLLCLVDGCLLGLIVWGIRVIFFPSGPGCMVYCGLSPSLRASHVSVMVMVLNTLSGSCLPPPGDFPVGFLLPGRAVCLHRCGAPARFEKRQSPSLCTVFSPVRVAFQYDFFPSFPFFIFFPILHLLACLEFYLFSLHTENFI